MYFSLNCGNRIRLSFAEFLMNLSSAVGLQTRAQDLPTAVNDCVRRLEQDSTNQNLIVLIKHCYTEADKMNTDCLASAENVANVHFLLGYLKSLLNSKIPPIDPVLKASLKKKYCEDETLHLEVLKGNYELLNMVYSDSSKTVHSYCGLLIGKIEELQRKVEKYEKCVAVRPELSYESLFMVKHFIVKENFSYFALLGDCPCIFISVLSWKSMDFVYRNERAGNEASTTNDTKMFVKRFEL